MAKGLLGVDKVMRNLNKEILKIKGRSMAGLIESSIVIRRDMDKRPPKIPVNFGNLRASWFTTTGTTTPARGGNFKGEDSGEMVTDHSRVLTGAAGRAKATPMPILIMGFSANYGIFVHEMDFTKGKRPGSGPKFFESALNRNHATIISIIQRNARIK